MLNEIIQILTFVVLAISAAASTFLFFKSKNKDREKETYDYIDDKFNEFLQICLDKPYLDVFDEEDEHKVQLNEMQKKEEKVAFAYLMSIFERVYIFYMENGKNSDVDQMENWKKTIKSYFKRENFRRAWEKNSYGWDTGFILFMDKLFLQAENKIELVTLNTEDELKIWADAYQKHFTLDKNNDQVEQLNYYLQKPNQYPYKYYFLHNCNHEMVGGMLVQEIDHVVIILYLFVNNEWQRQGFASYALRTLRMQYDEHTNFIAEVELRNNEHKSFWLDNFFEVVDMVYYTPEINEIDKQEEKVVHVNDLLIYQHKPLKTRQLSRVLSLYFQTSFVHDRTISVSKFKAVSQNKTQLKAMGNIVLLK